MNHHWQRGLGLVASLALGVTAPALEWKATTLTVIAAPFQIAVDAGFPFVNRGSRPVTIRDVATNCDCLEAGADRKVYAPGASGVVRAQFAVADRTGTHERTIAVLTDESDQPVHLVLRIEVPAVATLTPRSVDWPQRGPGAEKIIELEPAAGLEINFAETAVTNDAFAARLETVVAGRHYRLHLQPRDTSRPASAAIRIFGHESSGHDVVVSAYANVE